MAVAMGHLSRRLCSEFKMNHLLQPWMKAVDPKGYCSNYANHGIKVIHCGKPYYLSKTGMKKVVDRIARVGWLPVCFGQEFRSQIKAGGYVDIFNNLLGEVGPELYTPNQWYASLRRYHCMTGKDLDADINRILTQSGLRPGASSVQEPMRDEGSEYKAGPEHSHHG